MPMRMAGDVAGPMLRLLGEPDTPNAPECGPSDAQDALFLVHVRDAWVGPTVGQPSECVLVSDIVYNG